MKTLRSFFYAISLAFILPFFAYAAAPLIDTEEFYPADDATIALTDLEIFFVFDQEVTVGEGFITLYKSSDDSVVASLDVTEDVDLDESEVEASFDVTLEYGTEYYFNIDAGAFIGEDEDPFAGILDKTTWNVTTRDPVVDPEFDFERVSISDDEEEFEEGNSDGHISSDGRYVVFSKQSSPRELYVRDRAEGTTVLISDNAETDTKTVSISDDGIYITFATSDALDGGDVNGSQDVYLYNRIEESFELVSVNEGGVGGSSQVQTVAVSPDGHYVAFGTNDQLLPGVVDGNNLYLRDTQDDTTILLLEDSAGADLAFSGDGNLLALNTPEDIDGLDSNGEYDAYVYDISEDSFELISLTEDGSAAAGQVYFFITISSSGRYVLFTSRADTLTEDEVDGSDALYLRDRQEGTTTYLAGGVEGGGVLQGDISGDERYVVYDLQAQNVAHIYRYDLTEETTLFVTEGVDDGNVGSIQNNYPEISDDGSIIVFRSNGINLIDDDANNTTDIFLWDESVQVEDDDEKESEDEEEDNGGGRSGSSGGHRHSTGVSNSVIGVGSPDEAKVMELQVKLIELLKQLLLLLLGQQ